MSILTLRSRCCRYSQQGLQSHSKRKDYMSTDTSKMSAAELRELANSLLKQAEEQSTREFESTMNFLADKLHRTALPLLGQA